ncbi:MAG: hypothetical protein CR976_01615, partial [Thiotrichales bacterium]
MALSAEPVICNAGDKDLGGQVWRDYNANGIRDEAEPGYYDAGVVVRAFDTNNTEIATTTLSVDGSYVFAGLFAANSAVRVEFAGLPDGVQNGQNGTDGNTTVQFHDVPGCSASLAVQDPAEYCQVDPIISTTHFWPLEQNTNDPTLVGFRYSSGVTAPDGEHYKLSSWQNVSPHTFGESRQLGATFGIAWNRSEQYIYSAAIKEQYVGFGPGGRGQIYRTKISPVDGSVVSATESWVNVETDLGMSVCGTHNNLAAAGYSDEEFDQVGKCSLGDL